jgi:hypothetical protein
MLNSKIIKKIKQHLVSGKMPVNIIKDIFKGRTALVVSAGPSAIGWKEVYDRTVNENPLVVCIKQTVEMDGLSDLCDIHFINPYNLKRFKYKTKPLIIFSDAADSPRVYNEYDIKFIVKKKPAASLQSTVAYSGEFKKFELETTGVSRPWGPGVMYESVLYTLQHMGVTKIVTIGWDIADDGGRNSHYYDQKNLTKIVEAGIRRVLCKLRIIGIYNYLLYLAGRKYNYAAMLDGEAEIISKSIPNLISWLNRRGIELEINSKSKWTKKK